MKNTVILALFLATAAQAEGPGSIGTGGGGGVTPPANGACPAIYQLFPEQVVARARILFPRKAMKNFAIGEERCFGIPAIMPKCTIWAQELEIEFKATRRQVCRGKESSLRVWGIRGGTRKEIKPGDLRKSGSNDVYPESELRRAVLFDYAWFIKLLSRDITWEDERLADIVTRNYNSVFDDRAIAIIAKVRESATLDDIESMRNVERISDAFIKSNVMSTHAGLLKTFSMIAEDEIIKRFMKERTEIRRMISQVVDQAGQCDRERYKNARERLLNWNFGSAKWLKDFSIKTGFKDENGLQARLESDRQGIYGAFWSDAELPCSENPSAVPPLAPAAPTTAEEPALE